MRIRGLTYTIVMILVAPAVSELATADSHHVCQAVREQAVGILHESL